MDLDRKIFFDEIRGSVFKGSLSEKQVEGLDILLNIWEDDFSSYPDEFLAYCLGTTYHETARTMQPIREYGRGRGRKYGRPDPKTGQTYYGRGFVQLTWLFNYARAGRKLSMDLISKPDKVMIPEVAATILYRGCIEGWFTTKKLSDYITETSCNYRQARRIVNGMDKATLIAGYAKKFAKAIEAARHEPVITAKKLEKAGSRTAKAVRKNNDTGGAIVGIGVAGGAAEALRKLKDVTEGASSWRTVLDSLVDTLSWLSSFWYLGVAAAGGVLLWNNRRIIRARIEDEMKIGRLSDD
ncbi:MAG: hypothetical protein DHS20C08_04760 [Rhodomicrobium sp.]|nr:MAG: hypothetical protein DHS20C08_04760 [Rhodomicrobium sp.]